MAMGVEVYVNQIYVVPKTPDRRFLLLATGIKRQVEIEK